jgi:hypothetical protein
MDVRHALYRTLEDAQDVYVQVAGARHPESRRILALAQRAFGDLRGLLRGLPTGLLTCEFPRTACRDPLESTWPATSAPSSPGWRPRGRRRTDSSTTSRRAR